MGAGYKRKLLELKSLRQKASESAYDRAKLLSEIFADEDFRADNVGKDEFELTAVLDTFCDDLVVAERGGALALIKMYAHYPSKDQWLSGNLAQMYQDMIASLNQPSADAEESRPVRRATLRELEEAKEETKRAATRADMLASELERAQRRIAELCEENAVLRGKVAALEQMMQRTAAVA